LCVHLRKKAKVAEQQPTDQQTQVQIQVTKQRHLMAKNLSRN
jgi:hypothetical protein